MTPHTPAIERRPARVGRWVVAGAALVLLLGAAGAWWLVRPLTGTPPEPPPMPGDLDDPEVRRVIERARQAVLDQPDSAAAWGHLGKTLLAQQYEAEADRCFAEAARLDPADAVWPYFRGLYALRYDPDNALPFLRQAAAGHAAPEARSALCLRLAEALLERQELAEAERLFREEWAREPGNPRAAFGLGLIALDCGDEAAAAEFLTAARASPTARKAATAELAALARARGDEAAAARLEREAAALTVERPSWPDPLVDEMLRLQVGASRRSRDIARLESGRNYAQAARLYESQLDKQPTAAACIGAGLNLARLKDFDRALPLLRRAGQLEPDNCHTHFCLAQALYLRAEAAEKRSPGSSRAREDFREAAETARRAVARKPDHAAAYLLWGRALLHLGEAGAAVEPLTKGVACRPEVFNLQLALGEALLEAGRLPEAETHLENARKLDPADPRPGQALERLRQRKRG
jgi:tetratricopeptide (TPR) repeat protein